MLILKKLEQEEVVHHSKGLILDPHHHHHHHQHHLHLYQQLLNSRQEEKEEEEENQEIEIGFHGFHQNHHQLQQNQEIPPPNNHRVLHGGLGGPARQPPPRPQKKRPFLPSSVDHLQEYAPEKMGESYQYHNQQLQHHQHQQQQQQQASGSSRLGLRAAAVAGGGGGGEIVEVQGGHIVRSTGRKDRHSKVCTAKGPRDRRVRLSAHTAIQFYDVQDRLGYDRPSKAVDWLIKKAKAAIDELAELPAWKPTATISTTTPNSTSVQDFEQNPDQQHQLSHFEQHPDDNIVDTQMGNSQNSSFLPPSLDSDSIADTIKSFFPMGASSNPGSNNNNNNNNTSSGMQFHQSFPPPDLLSRSNSRSQDLRLSLQSFQDPILHHHHEQNNNSINNNNNSSIFFDGSGWPDNQPGGYQRMVTWGGVGGGDAVSAGFVFSSVPAAPAPAFLQPLFGQTTNNQYNSQRGPLQSSNAPSFRAWIDPPAPPYTGVAVDQHPTLAFHHPASMSGFASGLGGFSGFRIPARIQGDEEEHDGISDKPSSASSDSRH